MVTYESRVHARNLVTWAKDRPEVLVLSGDLTGSTEISDFKQAYPDRFISMGMAEQNMLSWAGGLAREGFTPFLHTFAVFLVRRPYDQLSMSVAYPNLRVRLFGFLPGITTPGGVTHQAIEDISLMRGVPNMTVLEVGDATEVESVLDVAQAVDGPVYVRMLRGEIPRLFAEPMELNRIRVLSEGEDVCVISSGICTEEAMLATQVLADEGISVTHLHAATLKPFSDPQVVAATKAVRHGVITFENHSVIGGLGSAVAEVMAEAGVGTPLTRLGLQDTYAHGASRDYLQRAYGLTAQALIESVGKVMGRDITVDDQVLTAAKEAGPAELSDLQLEAL